MKNFTQLSCTLFHPRSSPIAIILASTIFIFGCATAMKSPDGAIAARNSLIKLQNNPELAQRVTVAIRQADIAVTQAETPIKDKALSDHLVFIAGREVEIAWAQAETRSLEDKRSALSSQRDSARLDARTREADKAHSDSDELRRQIAELNAQKTERGLVVTLGDMLFETGKSQIKGSAAENLYKLTSFLKSYPDRSLLIEGHTDNVGSPENNMLLSQRRADAVRVHLLEQGINTNRLSATGKGENYPVATNESISGRALNRRVEVIIADSMMNASMTNDQPLDPKSGSHK